MRLSDTTVIITGGASGIGKACADRLAAEGARIAVLDLRPNPDHTSLSTDIADASQVQSAIHKITSLYGPVHVLINSAGVAVRKTISELEEPDWDRCIDVNLKGVYLASRFTIPHMGRGASIIHIASAVGIVGVRNRAVYTATKGAIVALTRNMALDYADRGIRVNCICPGFVRTPLLDGLLKDPVRTLRLTAMHPLGRIGEPMDIANAALFLASSEADWITGHSLVVDGGFSAGRQEDI